MKDDKDQDAGLRGSEAREGAEALASPNLREALLQWDQQSGEYPEHEYEGLAFWLWLTGGRTRDRVSTEDVSAWKAEMKR